MNVNDVCFKVFKNQALQMFCEEVNVLKQAGCALQDLMGNRIVFIYEKTSQGNFKTTYVYIFLAK